MDLYESSDGTILDLDVLTGHRRRIALALVTSGDLKPKKTTKKQATTPRKKG